MRRITGFFATALLATAAITAPRTASAGAIALVPENFVSLGVYALRLGETWTERVEDVLRSGALSVAAAMTTRLQAEHSTRGRVAYQSSVWPGPYSGSGRIGALAMVDPPWGNESHFARLRHEMDLSFTVTNHSLNELTGLYLSFWRSVFLPYSMPQEWRSLLNQFHHFSEVPMGFVSDTARFGTRTRTSMSVTEDTRQYLLGFSEIIELRSCTLPSGPNSDEAIYSMPAGNSGRACGIYTPDDSLIEVLLSTPNPSIPTSWRFASPGVGESVTFNWTLAIEVEAWSVGIPVSEPGSLPLFGAALAVLGLAFAATARSARGLTAVAARP